MKYKYINRLFWCRCYYVDTVGKADESVKAGDRAEIFGDK